MKHLLFAGVPLATMSRTLERRLVDLHIQAVGPGMRAGLNDLAVWRKGQPPIVTCGTMPHERHLIDVDALVVEIVFEPLRERTSSTAIAARSQGALRGAPLMASEPSKIYDSTRRTVP